MCFVCLRTDGRRNDCRRWKGNYGEESGEAEGYWGEVIYYASFDGRNKAANHGEESGEAEGYWGEVIYYASSDYLDCNRMTEEINDCTFELCHYRKHSYSIKDVSWQGINCNNYLEEEEDVQAHVEKYTKNEVDNKLNWVELAFFFM